jgi:LacI family transcriptional regulator
LLQSKHVPPPRRTVALIIETSNSYARELLRGIRAWGREHEAWAFRLVEQGRGAAVPAWLRRWPGDGIIARVENEAIAGALKATRLPVVDVSAALPEPAFPRVVTNSEAVTRLAAEHLLERGFTHFGYCGDPQFLWSAQRRKYFETHLRKRGMSCSEFDPRKIPTGTTTAEGEVSSIARWLAQLPKPVGVLACYDIRGQQVLEACRLAQLAVPEEVAVIGVHNDELLCELCDPPLTSVIPNARRAGFLAAGLLARMMQGDHVPPQVHYVEPIGVAARQSTDAVAVTEPKISAVVRFIRDHAAERITVSDVLRAVPMARTLLERKFKQFFGHTPHEYIQRVRLDRAKMLLNSTDLPVGAIAERLGFEYSEYLSVAFKRATGLTPKSYRASHRAGGP